jgi:DHA1 family multidrug resistance protein-like MFS transporter
MKKIPLFLLMFNNFTVLLGVGIIIPVLPEYLKYFHASGTTAGLLVAAFGLTQLIFSPLGGKWSDRYGRKPLILSGMVLNALSHLLFAVADQLSLLYVSRLIGGVGLGLTIPAIMAYVADVTDREQRGKGMGWIGASVSLGIAVGPGIGGLLVDISIRAPYYAAAILNVVAIVISGLLLPETRTTRPQAQAPHEPVSLKASLLRQFQYATRSGMFMLLLLNLVLAFGLMSFETIFPLFSDDRYGFSTKEIAIIVTAGAVLGVVAQTFLLTKLTTRYGEVRLINITLCFAACTLPLMLIWGSFSIILLLSMLFFAFQSLLRPVLSTLLSKRASEDEQGYVAGLGNTFMSIGNILGPVAAGILYDVQQLLPYLFGALILLVGMGLFMVSESKGSREINQLSQ